MCLLLLSIAGTWPTSKSWLLSVSGNVKRKKSEVRKRRVAYEVVSHFILYFVLSGMLGRTIEREWRIVSLLPFPSSFVLGLHQLSLIYGRSLFTHSCTHSCMHHTRTHARTHAHTRTHTHTHTHIPVTLIVFTTV